MSGTGFETRLAAKAAALSRERSPGRDLWPGIEARIAPRRRLVPGLAAAALIAGIALALTLAWPPERRAPAPSVEAPSAAQSAAEMDRGYRDALLAVLERAGPLPLSGERAVMARADFDELDFAQREIRRALLAQPDADYLVSLLEQTHAQRLELVRELAANAATNGGQDERQKV